MTDSPCQYAELPRCASIDVSGRDARAFLAAQLSQMPPAPESSQATLAAWHDAKGRVQGLFHVISDGAAFRLLTDVSVAADVVAALRRYVLRADVQIDVADAATGAILGSCSAWLDAHGFDLGHTPGATARAGKIRVLRLGPALLHVIGPAEALASLASDLEAAEAGAADLAEIRLGLPTVGAALRGLFLPQMLNLDRLGAIAFDKGCYPGQEIIARTQNLGTVKRRLHHFVLAPSEAVPAPGAKLLDDAGREVGIVVRAAAAGGRAELLAVVELDALTRPLAGDWNPAARLDAAPARGSL